MLTQSAEWSHYFGTFWQPITFSVTKPTVKITAIRTYTKILQRGNLYTACACTSWPVWVWCMQWQYRCSWSQYDGSLFATKAEHDNTETYNTIKKKKKKKESIRSTKPNTYSHIYTYIHVSNADRISLFLKTLDLVLFSYHYSVILGLGPCFLQNFKDDVSSLICFPRPQKYWSFWTFLL